jgi:hypothetical protein
MTATRGAASASSVRAAPVRAAFDAPRVGRRPVVVSSDYSKLDVPAYERLKAAAGDGLRHEPEAAEDILDIPAFLRRQAD